MEVSVDLVVLLVAFEEFVLLVELCEFDVGFDEEPQADSVRPAATRTVAPISVRRPGPVLNPQVLFILTPLAWPIGHVRGFLTSEPP